MSGGKMLKQWRFAVLLLCFPVSLHGGAVSGLTNRVKRTVTDAQLMHDKSRALQAFKRRLWLHELLQQVHTAVLHDSVRIAVIRNPTASRPGPAPRLKPARVSKQTQPLAFPIDGAGTHVVSSPQETEKASGFRGQSAKGPGQRRKATTWYGKWSQKEKRRRHNAAV